MIVSDSNLRRQKKPHLLRKLLLLLLLGALLWFGWVYHQIQTVAQQDQAQPADAIAVFGAAEYGGRPSPVLHARLDHAVELYDKGIAPVIITLGGGTRRDAGNTEGAVGRDYLLANGVPYDKIIAETESMDTEQQAAKLAAIARANHFNRIVVVSDNTHLFRIQKLCQADGLYVFTSPRPPLGHISESDMAERVIHEVLSYTQWRLHLHFSWLHEWVESKSDS